MFKGDLIKEKYANINSISTQLNALKILLKFDPKPPMALEIQTEIGAD